MLGSVSTIQTWWDENSGRVIVQREMVFWHQKKEVGCWTGQGEMIYVYSYICVSIHLCLRGKILLSRSLYSLASFLIQEPSSSLPPPTLGTWMLPKKLDHSVPLARVSYDSFSETSLAAHPHELPQLFSTLSPCFSLSQHFSQYRIILSIFLSPSLPAGHQPGEETDCVLFLVMSLAPQTPGT